MRPGPLVLLLLLLTLPAGADDTPWLVRDLPGVNVRDSIDFVEPNVWTTIGDTTWFAARTASGKTEIFRTDGTLAGTVQVTYGAVSPDIETGWFVGVVNGKLVYAGSGALFALDTAGGQPVRLADVIFVEHGTTAGDTLYFTGSATMMLREPWRTDGTPEGTAPIDMLPGQPGSLEASPHPALLRAGERFVFLGETPKGRGVHATDGTIESLTLLVPAGEPQWYTGDVTRLYPLGDRVLFYRWGFAVRPHELFVTDGTAAGTASIAQPLGFFPLAAIGDQLFFQDGRGWLWITDGTAAGTRQTDVVFPAAETVHAATVVGEDIYFIAGFTRETLYVTRGTPETTRAIMEVNHGTRHEATEGFAAGGRFVFRHDDGIHGMELWSTGGTTAALLADIYPGPRSGIDAGFSAASRPDGTALFAATAPGIGREPWITDGTVAGTRLLANIAAEDSAHGSSPRSLRASEGRVFFVATTVEGEEAVGVSDGTRAGTSALAPGFARTIHGTAAAAGRYFFSPRTADPFGLYSSDGTAAGTVGLYPDLVHPEPLPNGVVFLDRDDEAVWFSDGTIAGTRRLPGITAPDSTILSILPAGDLAWISTEARRVWRTDGSDAGTVEIAGFDGEIYDAIATGTRYFLLEANGTLWRSDGTSTGTRVVKAFGNQLINPTFVGTAGGLVYLSVGGVLHRSDGTEAGTFALPVTAPCEGVDLGGTLLFTAVPSPNTLELWAGTTKVATFPVTATCKPLGVRGNRAYFAGWDAEHGWEPWVTDGTTASMLADIYPGTDSSLPGEFTAAGGRVFFSADSPGNGRELWAIGGNPGPARRRSVRP